MSASKPETVLPTAANDTEEKSEGKIAVSPISKELFIGLVGYAGAGCSNVTSILTEIFQDCDYKVIPIKVSDLIANASGPDKIPAVGEGADRHKESFERAKALQNAGDELRRKHGGAAAAVLAVKDIKKRRGDHLAGEQKHVYLIDSLKHSDEAELLRHIYDKSFRLLAVHCSREYREDRLIGKGKKFAGVSRDQVEAFLDRDEKDASANGAGQEVRDVFFKADFFLDNNYPRQNLEALRGPLDRFVKLLFGRGVPTPTKQEAAMYMAFGAALGSACLSRKVGATLIGSHGDIISQGYNEVPKYGGGVYQQGTNPDNRCMHFEFDFDGNTTWKGCHNSRKKRELKQQISKWIADEFSQDLATAAHPQNHEGEMDLTSSARKAAEKNIREFLESSAERLQKMPGVSDLIEYSRSIHAEMSALFNAARAGNSTKGSILACTTFPCHNCARHLVTAGVKEVYYIEPYVKSAAIELHGDAISTNKDDNQRMRVLPFTGVGPMMYKDHFEKRREVKASDGELLGDDDGEYAPIVGTPIRDLTSIEAKATELI